MLFTVSQMHFFFPLQQVCYRSILSLTDKSLHSCTQIAHDHLRYHFTWAPTKC